MLGNEILSVPLDLFDLKEVIQLKFDVTILSKSFCLPSVAGIPLTFTILATGAVCTFYTALVSEM